MIKKQQNITCHKGLTKMMLFGSLSCATIANQNHQLLILILIKKRKTIAITMLSSCCFHAYTPFPSSTLVPTFPNSN